MDAAVRTPLGADGPVLLDLGGRKVGRAELRASPGCGTMWAKVYFDQSVAPSLRGQQVVLVMDRPADDAQVRYVLPLQGGTEGFSNMISVGDTCGEDDSAVDDANPGLHTSFLWYGVRHGDRMLSDVRREDGLGVGVVAGGRR
jgi:hypothetical protein